MQSGIFITDVYKIKNRLTMQNVEEALCNAVSNIHPRLNSLCKSKQACSAYWYKYFLV